MRRNERKKKIEDEDNRETRECLPGIGICGGPKWIVTIEVSIVAIKADMGAIRAGIGAIKASANAIRKNTFAIRKA